MALEIRFSHLQPWDVLAITIAVAALGRRADGWQPARQHAQNRRVAKRRSVVHRPQQVRVTGLDICPLGEEVDHHREISGLDRSRDRCHVVDVTLVDRLAGLLQKTAFLSTFPTFVWEPVLRTSKSSAFPIKWQHRKKGRFLLSYLDGSLHCGEHVHLALRSSSSSSSSSSSFFSRALLLLLLRPML